jgi:hypothetical protein
MVRVLDTLARSVMRGLDEIRAKCANIFLVNLHSVERRSHIEVFLSARVTTVTAFLKKFIVKNAGLLPAVYSGHVYVSAGIRSASDAMYLDSGHLSIPITTCLEIGSGRGGDWAARTVGQLEP